MQDANHKEQSQTNQSAVQRAIEQGIDITLLIENLKLTPTERLRRGQRIMRSMLALQSEMRKFRTKHRGHS